MPITIPAARLRNPHWSTAIQRLILVRPMPSSTTFALVRLVRQLERESQAIEATRKTLIEKYGEQDGRGFKLKPENEATFRAEWSALLEVPITLDLKEKIKLPEKFESGNGSPESALSASDILLLEEILIAD